MLILHHDVTSPAAAVAVLRLQRLVDRGANVRFSPLDALGLDISVPPTAALLEGVREHTAAAAALGLELRVPDRQPPTLRAHLVGTVAEEHDLGASWRSRCLRAYWTEGRDLDDEATLVQLAVDAGLSEGPVRGVLADPSRRRALRGEMLTQRRRGIGGVPVLELDGTFVPADLPDDDLAHLAGL